MGAIVPAMFELQRLQGTPPPSIALQTRLGTDIKNSLGPAISEAHQRRHELLVRKYGDRWKQRRPPAGGYNCAGHVWASRRTCIYEPDEWQRILTDDGYRKTTSPQPDDLVIYADYRDGILHVARVLELRRGIVEGSPLLAWVVSKWNDWSGESYHFVHDHPLGEQGFDVSIVYWTDRPKEARV